MNDLHLMSRNEKAVREETKEKMRLIFSSSRTLFSESFFTTLERKKRERRCTCTRTTFLFLWDPFSCSWDLSLSQFLSCSSLTRILHSPLVMSLLSSKLLRSCSPSSIFLKEVDNNEGGKKKCLLNMPLSSFWCFSSWFFSASCEFATIT